MKLRSYIFICLLMLTGVSLAAEISGTVYLSSSKGQKPIGNVPMRMHIYKDDYEFSGVEAKTDNSGKYHFHDLNPDARYSYLFYPVYKGVNYPFQEITLDKTPSVKKDFVITETTGSTENISVDESIFFDFGKKDVWKVTHDIKLTNNGDLMYHPDRPDAQPLSFALFESGFDLSYLDGVTRENSKIDDEKDIMRMMLTIAAHDTIHIKFAYYYIPSSRHVSFSRDALLARSNVSLFFGKNVHVVSTQFQMDPLMAKTQKDYTRAYTSGPIAQNQKITFEIKGLFLDRDLLHIVVLALCLVLLIGMIVFSLTLGKVQKSSDKQLTQKMQLYLIDLQKQRKDGKIDEQFYKKEEYRVRNFLFQMSKSKQK